MEHNEPNNPAKPWAPEGGQVLEPGTNWQQVLSPQPANYAEQVEDARARRSGEAALIESLDETRTTDGKPGRSR